MLHMASRPPLSAAKRQESLPIAANLKRAQPHPSHWHSRVGFCCPKVKDSDIGGLSEEPGPHSFPTLPHAQGRQLALKMETGQSLLSETHLHMSDTGTGTMPRDAMNHARRIAVPGLQPG
jgi:hypothetical protein